MADDARETGASTTAAPQPDDADTLARFSAAHDALAPLFEICAPSEQTFWRRACATAASRAERFEEAYAHYAVLASMNALLAQERYNMGALCHRLGRYDEAIEHYKTELSRAPSDVRTLEALTQAFRKLGRFEAVEATARRVLKIEPENLSAHINLAMSLMARGLWREGFPHYEARLKKWALHPEMPYKPFSGRLETGHVLLLRAEQGLGDTIMFARVAMELGRRGYPASPCKFNIPSRRFSRTCLTSSPYSVKTRR